MRILLKLKFPDNMENELSYKLANITEGLLEGNNWKDKFWGAVWNKKIGKWNGANHLGRLLMARHAELASQECNSMCHDHEIF